MCSGKVLVTGASGFLGSSLVEALRSKGYDVRCFVRKSSDTIFLEGLGVEFAYGDITDKASLWNALSGVEVVFHLAGLLGKWRVPAGVYHDVHVGGTQTVLDACLKQGISRLIYCSSSGVLGPLQGLGDERSPYNPSNPYEYAKAEAEKVVLRHKDDLDVTVIRPGLVYGPRDLHMLALFKSLKDRRFFIIGDGKALLHPVYVGDLDQSFLLCLENPRSIGEVYLIGGERPVTVEEFINLFSENLGSKASFRHVPLWGAKLLAGVAESSGRLLGFEPPLTYSRVKFFTENRAFSCFKAKTDLGYVPTSLNDSIKQTLNWYRKEGYL